MTFVLGILIAVSSIAYILIRSGSDLLHLATSDAGILIVVIGTACSVIATSKWTDLTKLLRVILRGLVHRSVDERKVIRAFVAWAQKGSSESAGFSKVIPHELWIAGAKMLEAGLEHNRLVSVLTTAHRERFAAQMHYAELVRGLGRYPPIFGMIGTVLGLVGLLSSIGDDVSGKGFGGHMASALLSTLAGLLLSNTVFVPLGDYLANQARTDARTCRLLTFGMGLIAKGEDPVFVEASLQALISGAAQEVEGDHAPTNYRRAA